MQLHRVHAHRPHSMKADECALKSLALSMITCSNGCLCTRETSRGQHDTLFFKVNFWETRWHLECASQDLENRLINRSVPEQSATKDGYWDKVLVPCTVLDRSVQTGKSRSAASALDCCHSYMQQVRNAVALVLLKEQQKAIESLEPSQVGIYILAFDETEQRMRVNGIASIYHLFMITGSLSWQTSATAPIKMLPIDSSPSCDTKDHRRVYVGGSDG